MSNGIRIDPDDQSHCPRAIDPAGWTPHQGGDPAQSGRTRQRMQDWRGMPAGSGGGWLHPDLSGAALGVPRRRTANWERANAPTPRRARPFATGSDKAPEPALRVLT